jgi:hypothetical protein
MFLRILQKFRKLDLVSLYLSGSKLNLISDFKCHIIFESNQ